MQVPLGRIEVSVPHVRREHGQLIAEIGALLIPSLKPVDSECVPKVMNAGASARPPVRDSTIGEKCSEGMVNTSPGIGFSGVFRKERRVERPSA
jgi:hypothetical protein